MKAGSLRHVEPAPSGLSHIRNIAKVGFVPVLERWLEKAGAETKRKEEHEGNKQTNKQKIKA